MLHPIDHNPLEPKNSVLEFKDLKSTRRKLTETELQPVLEIKVGGKKSFSDRWKTNRFWLVRATYHVLYSVWMVVMGIGTVIAWLIAMLFI